MYTCDLESLQKKQRAERNLLSEKKGLPKLIANFKFKGKII